MSHATTYRRLDFWLPLVGGGWVLFFTYLMLQITLPYLSGRTDVDFLLTKQHIIHLPHYRVAFYVHIFPSLLVLAAGATQFSTALLRRAPALHRTVGRVYVAVILLFSGPAAVCMALYANGGPVAGIAFGLLGMLWCVCTYQGWQAARRGDYRAHIRFMVRSYALTLSAITLRLLQMLNPYVHFLSPEEFYVVVAWASWLLNLALAEAGLRYARV